MAVMYEGYQLASVSVLDGDKEAFSVVWVTSKWISLEEDVTNSPNIGTASTECSEKHTLLKIVIFKSSSFVFFNPLLNQTAV